MNTPVPPRARRFRYPGRRARRLAPWGAALLSASLAGPAVAAPPASGVPEADLGPAVTVFTSQTPTRQIEDAVNRVADAQAENEMGRER
ncbi:hypothetical protein [Kineococcus sp. SYSU DK018]|uniref:hypothetical protein n=1 Tax=Kineococcus sp. SYSU DK018 TaxID=3383139 RepID=UPI003D7EE96F